MNRNYKYRTKNWPGQITPGHIRFIWVLADLCNCDAETLREGVKKYFFVNALNKISMRDAEQIIVYFFNVVKEKEEGTFQGSLF